MSVLDKVAKHGIKSFNGIKPKNINSLYNVFKRHPGNVAYNQNQSRNGFYQDYNFNAIPSNFFKNNENEKPVSREEHNKLKEELAGTIAITGDLKEQLACFKANYKGEENNNSNAKYVLGGGVAILTASLILDKAFDKFLDKNPDSSLAPHRDVIKILLTKPFSKGIPTIIAESEAVDKALDYVIEEISKEIKSNSISNNVSLPKVLDAHEKISIHDKSKGGKIKISDEPKEHTNPESTHNNKSISQDSINKCNKFKERIHAGRNAEDYAKNFQNIGILSKPSF